MKLTECPWCGGKGTEQKATCPACGGEKLVTPRLAKVIEAAMELKDGWRRVAMERIAGLRKVEAERVAHADLPVPASFTNKKPDTPESIAARTLDKVSKGKAELPAVYTAQPK